VKGEKVAEPFVAAVAVLVAAGVPSPQFSLAVKESPAGAVQVTFAVMVREVWPAEGAARVQDGGGEVVSLMGTENDWFASA
jgi:hypothetical protein